MMADDEDLSTLLQLIPEKVLLRWINFQLNMSSYSKTVDSFGESLKDGVALSVLVRTVASDYCAEVPMSVAGEWCHVHERLR